MAKDLGLCCPLCLGVDDPSGMLAVTIAHQNPPGERQIFLCIGCFTAVIEAARQQNDELNGREGFNDVSRAEPASVSESNDSSPALSGLELHPDRPPDGTSIDAQPDAQSLPTSVDETAERD